MVARARSQSSSDTSRPTVSKPAWTQTCAIPAPIVPSPTTPTVRISTARDPSAPLDCVRYLRYLAPVGEDETFQIPVPPPPFPHHDVVFFRGPGPEGAGDREHEDILLRRGPRDTDARVRAGGRRPTLVH